MNRNVLKSMKDKTDSVSGAYQKMSISFSFLLFVLQQIDVHYTALEVSGLEGCVTV